MRWAVKARGLAPRACFKTISTEEKKMHNLALAIAGHHAAVLLIAAAFALLAGTAIVASTPAPLTGTASPDYSTAAGQGINLPFQYEVLTGTTDVIQGGGGSLKALAGNPGATAPPICGTSFIETAGVDACTIAAPVAGPPSAGGNDGLEITIFDNGGHIHTVTAPAGAITPAHHLLTFSGTQGAFITLVARNGKWLVAASSGVTPS